MNRFIKSISELIISTSNATLEVPSLRPCLGFLVLNLTPAHFLVERKFNVTKKDKDAFLKVIDFQK